MSKTNADLLAMKTELTNDPIGLGLTLNAADDEVNADKINEVQDQFQIDRETIPAQEVFIQVDRDEYAALAPADREWLNAVTASGSINPRADGEVREGLLQIFSAGTESRDNISAILTEDGSRWQKMLADDLLEEEGNWTASDIANSRQAT